MDYLDLIMVSSWITIMMIMVSSESWAILISSGAELWSNAALSKSDFRRRDGPPLQYHCESHHCQHESMRENSESSEP